MDIRHETSGSGGRFTTGEGASRAELTYRVAGDGILVFDHTYVPPSARGGGMAERLVEAGVAFARARQARVVPRCSYVAALFRRRPDDFADVAAPSGER